MSANNGSTIQDIDSSLDDMWESATNQIRNINPATENWKAQSLPLARIKKIMKSEECVYQEMERERLRAQLANTGQSPPNVSTRFMIAGEAPVLLGKACELLVKELTVRAWRHTERNRRRTLQRQDVHAAVGESEVYDFLIDIVPRIAASQTVNHLPVQHQNHFVASGQPVVIDQTAQPQQHHAMQAIPIPNGNGMHQVQVTQIQEPPQMMHEQYLMQMQQAKLQAEQQHHQQAAHHHHHHPQLMQPPPTQPQQQQQHPTATYAMANGQPVHHHHHHHHHPAGAMPMHVPPPMPLAQTPYQATAAPPPPQQTQQQQQQQQQPQ